MTFVQAWPLLVVIAVHSLVEALMYMVLLPMRHQDSQDNYEPAGAGSYEAPPACTSLIYIISHV